MTRADALRYAAQLGEAVERQSERADVALRELRGALLMNHLLVKRLGGTVEISAAELAEARGQLRVQHILDDGRDVYLLTAVEPEPAPAAEETQGQAGSEISNHGEGGA